MLLVEFLLCCLPMVGDTIPLPPQPVLPLPSSLNEDDILVTYERMPVLLSCSDLPLQEQNRCTGEKLMEFIESNLKWPAPDYCGEGIVVIRITVDAEGKLQEAMIVRPLQGTEREVDRLIGLLKANFPVWQAGTFMGNPFEIEFLLPIKFKLE